MHDFDPSGEPSQADTTAHTHGPTRLHAPTGPLAEAEADLATRMLAVVSHDLRTPLSAIVAGLDMLREETQLSTEGRDILQRLERSAAWMSNTITRLLDLTALREPQGLQVRIVEADLCKLVQERVDEFQSTHPGRELRCSYQGHGQSLQYLDPVAIGQVVINLVGNALQHGDPQSPIWVEVQCTATHSSLAVSNLGPPIPPMLQAQIFEPFVRHPQASGQRLGLGLFITREIANTLGAELEFLSNANRTTFTLTLPRCCAL